MGSLAPAANTLGHLHFVPHNAYRGVKRFSFIRAAGDDGRREWDAAMENFEGRCTRAEDSPTAAARVGSEYDRAGASRRKERRHFPLARQLRENALTRARARFIACAINDDRVVVNSRYYEFLKR